MTALDYFRDKAVWLMTKLIEDFGLTPFQAAGVAGNGYQESLLKPIQEVHPLAGKGGLGWFQWTGIRRRQFLLWCELTKLAWQSDEANYGFLKHELETDYKHALSQLKQTKNLSDAVLSFEKFYEGAGIPMMGHRYTGGQIALEAYVAAKGSKQ